MKIIVCLLTIIAGLTLLPTTASAGIFRRRAAAAANKDNKSAPRESMPAADARIEKMHKLIEAGTKNGKLTKAETGSLTRELEVIERREEQYRRSMDKVTSGERRKLNQEITDLHQRIYDKVHNAAKA